MKKFFLGFIALFVSLTVFGAPRTAEEAAIIAAQFTNQQPAFRHLHRAALTANDLRLAHQTNKPSSNEAALYVFNKANDGGFVMVSADDNAVAILGYSDEGSFEVENINPNLQFWLGYYAERIANAQPVAHKNRAIRKAIQATTVSPLLGNIKWNQGTPYYNMCPMDPVDNTRSYTGCVATAAAQIMKYYNWPTTGEGTKTYTWTNDHGGSGTETVNFGATTYDWANMLDTYTSSANATQKNAVALLMYHVGVSCEMEYGGETTNGSGSQTSKMRTGLVNYFRYKSTATYGNGKTHAQLATIFTTELQNGRPILMGGDDGGQFGHEFVCDGLDFDDSVSSAFL